MRGIAWAQFARRREMLHIAMLVILDSIAMTAAFEIARALRGGSERPMAHVLNDMHFTAVMASIIPLWITIFAICGLYRVQVHGGRVSEVGRVVAAVIGGVMLLISVDYYNFSSELFSSHAVPVFALLIGTLLVVLERQVVRGVMRTMFGTGRGLHNVILIGTGPLAVRIAKELTKPKSGYRLMAAVGQSNDRLRMIGGAPRLPHSGVRGGGVLWLARQRNRPGRGGHPLGRSNSPDGLRERGRRELPLRARQVRHIRGGI